MPDGPALATLAEFADYLQVDEADLERGGDDLLEAASSLVRNVGLDQRVDFVEDDVVEVDGDGTNSLLLPELPAIAVTSVATYSSTGALEAALVAGTDYRFKAGRDGAYGVIERLPRGLVWPRGEPVRVVYSHGFRLEAVDPDPLDVPLVPRALKLIVMRIAARGIFNPGSLTQQSAGRVVQQFGMDASRVATLTDADHADLAPWLPGSASGAR